ncbi:hypothetical protein Bcell_0750 [Evansella cellulosilytica DSM 2522]|uniref:DUF4129 domain-containing protein n=2 Tax=Evansella TaxID=2837485 RepID=E6U027_EVAC2|nr:hypothetical protein Bcell_0750 [Evansella cellulosilytica DSM 2522]
MKSWQSECIRWGHYGQDLLLLYLILMPIYATEQRFPPAIPFLIISISSAIILGLVLKKTNSVKLTVLLCPLIVGMSVWLEFPLLLAIFFSLIFCWRVITHVDDAELDNELNLFFYTFFVGLFYYFAFHHFDERIFFFIFIFVQLVVTLGLKILSSIFHSTTSGKKSTQVKWLFGGLTVIVISSIIVAFSYPLFAKILVFTFNGIAHILALIAAPFLMLVQWLAKDTMPQEGEIVEESSGGEQIEQGFEASPPIVDTSEVFYGVLIILLIAGVITALIKMRRTTLNKKTPVIADEQESAVSPMQRSTNFSLKTLFTIKNEVRKQLFQLEIKLSKLGLGRKPDQTLEEWLSSLEVEASLKHTIIHTYEKVRYGEMDIKREDRVIYKQAIKQVIKQLKES